MKKLLVLVAGGVGYVLGTRAGRERYDQLRAAYAKVRNDPRVQEKTHQAADLAREKAPVVKDRLTDAADAATTRLRSAADGPDPGAKLNPDSTAHQDDPGPKGDLP